MHYSTFVIYHNRKLSANTQIQKKLRKCEMVSVVSKSTSLQTKPVFHPAGLLIGSSKIFCFIFVQISIDLGLFVSLALTKEFTKNLLSVNTPPLSRTEVNMDHQSYFGRW